MRRRLIQRGVISLTVGVILTVLVAWWAAVRPKAWLIRYPDRLEYFLQEDIAIRKPIYHWASEPFEDGGLFWKISFEAAGKTSVSTRLYLNEGWDAFALSLQSTPLMYTESPLPSWSRAKRVFREYAETRQVPIEPEHGPEYLARFTERAFGLPFRAMSFSYIVHGQSSQSNSLPLTFSNAVFLPENIRDLIDAFHTSKLPLRPLPLGFAINTLFYGGIIFGIWEGLGFAREARRRRKGLCARCAHSLEGLPENTPCPECGVTAN